MLKYCPNCGSELKKVFRFCPNCGINLEEVAANDIKKNEVYKVIICSNCGEENNPDNSSCAACGVKLEGEVVEKRESIVEPKVIHEPSKKKAELKNKTSAKNYSSSAANTLDTKKIILIFAGIFLIIFVILLAAGVFDTTKVPETNVNINPESQGPDLSNVNAINQLEDRVKNNPDDHESVLQLAHLLNDSKFYERAINYYKIYLDKKPENADARIDMGVCYYNLQQYDEAIAAMTKALEYQPNHQIGHLNLGIVNLSAGNLEKSKEWLRKAIEINPNNDIGKRAEELLKNH